MREKNKEIEILTETLKNAKYEKSKSDFCIVVFKTV
jgi:hypothetical protein